MLVLSHYFPNLPIIAVNDGRIIGAVGESAVLQLDIKAVLLDESLHLIGQCDRSSGATVNDTRYFSLHHDGRNLVS